MGRYQRGIGLCWRQQICEWSLEDVFQFDGSLTCGSYLKQCQHFPEMASLWKARNMRKENTTDMTSVMRSLKIEIATMLKSGNSSRRTNFLAFGFVLNFFKMMFHLPNITLVTLLKTLCALVFYFGISIKYNLYFTSDTNHIPYCIERVNRSLLFPSVFAMELSRYWKVFTEANFCSCSHPGFIAWVCRLQ